MTTVEAVPSADGDSHFRLMFDGSPVGMALVALDGSWIDVNAAVCNLTGYSREALLARDFQSITHPDDLDADLVQMQRLLAGEIDGYQLDKRYLRPDGVPVWALLSVSLVRSAAGAPEHFVVQIVDTDRLRRTETELATRDQLFRVTFEASPVGMAVSRQDGTIAEVNEALANMLGYPREEIIGRRHEDFTHPEDVGIGAIHAETTDADFDIHARYEKRYLRADGAVIWAQVSLSSAIGNDGAIVRLVHVEDNTAQHEALAATAREQTMLRALVDIQADIVEKPNEAAALNAVVDYALHLISNADGAVVELPDQYADQPVLRYAAVAGTLVDQVGLTVSVGASLSGHAYRHRTFVQSRDTGTDDRVDAAACERASIRSMMVAPLVAGDEALGVLKVASSSTDAFDGDDEQALLLLAHSLTGALRHTRDRDVIAERAQLLELASDAVIVRDMDDQIRYWNPGAERLYGWTAEAALGRNLERFLDAEFLGGADRAAARAQLLEEGHWEGEVEHGTADGRRVIVHSRKALQRDENGAPCGILAINTDITARRDAELALSTSEELFRSQFENSAVGQCIRNVDDTLESVNPALARMLGYDSPAELAGESARVYTTSEAFMERSAALAAVFAGECDSVAYETTIRRKDGTPIEVHFTSSALRGPTGRPVKFVSIFQDISARNAAERARDEAVAALQARHDELEEAERLKTDLIGMLGHEINTPLTVLVGAAELAEEHLDDDTAPQLREFITLLRRNSEQLQRTVADVLNLVTAESGHLIARPVPVTLSARLDNVLQVLDIEAEVTGTRDLEVLVQPEHFDQILSNLLSNAMKYGKPPLEIQVRRVADCAEVAVVDHGAGVPDEFLGHLFERFARDEDAARRAPGTGIGLYIIRELAEANSGQVLFSQTPGGGATFTLSLPLATYDGGR